MIGIIHTITRIDHTAQTSTVVARLKNRGLVNRRRDELLAAGFDVDVSYTNHNGIHVRKSYCVDGTGSQSVSYPSWRTGGI